MPEERRFVHPFQTGAVALAALAIECFLVYGYLAQQLSGWAALTAHVGVTAGIGVWCRSSPGLRADVRAPLLLAAGTAALGPIGAAGTLVTMALTRWYRRNATPFEEWYQSLFPDTRQQVSQEFSERVAGADLEKPGSLTPFAELLAFGSVHQKQSLIALISRQFRPAFGPILKRALTDGNNAVRVQAATAMNKLENAMLRRTLELDLRVRENARDAGALRDLALHYDDHLYSGLLDARREEQVRAQALDAHRRYTALEPGDLGSRFAAARLLLRGNQYAEAAIALEMAMQAGLCTPQADLWYMESLYQLGRFARLREFARSRQELLEAAENFPPPALEVVQVWGGQEPALQTGGAASE